MKIATFRASLAVAALLAIGAFAVVAVLLSRAGSEPREATLSEVALADALDQVLERSGGKRDRGIAVRPFATPAGDGDAADLAGATCEAIALRLARMPGLRAVSCRSTELTIAAALDDRALARLLAVDHILRGELRPLPAGQVQVRLELVEAAAGRLAWTADESFPVAALQGLPAKVSREVGGALGVDDAMPPPPPLPAEAYARLVRARELARRPSIDDRRTAVRLLDEVLAQAPRHAESLFLRHGIRGWLLGNDGSGTSIESLNAARAAHVEEGVALAQALVAADPQDLRAQWLLLGHELELRQMPAGFRRLDAMVARNPRLPGVLRRAARLHLHTGYVREAQRLALAAAQLDALDAEAYEILALTAGIERRDDAMREFAAIARQMGHTGLGRVEVFDAWRRKDWKEVERAHSAWVSWGGQWPADWVPAWVRGLADPDQREAAARLLDAHPPATRQHFASYFVEYALLGDAGRSLAAVRHHAKLPPATWMQHLWWPEFASVRAAPGFVEAMSDLGFTRLWEVRGAPDQCRRAADGGWSCG